MQLNTITEPVNGKIQELKMIGTDRKRFEHMGSMVLLIRGWLDLFPQDS